MLQVINTVDNKLGSESQGKRGIWLLLFTDRENGEFCCNTRNTFETQGFFDYKNPVLFCIFDKLNLTLNRAKNAKNKHN